MPAGMLALRSVPADLVWTQDGEYRLELPGTGGTALAALPGAAAVRSPSGEGFDLFVPAGEEFPLFRASKGDVVYGSARISAEKLIETWPQTLARHEAAPSQEERRAEPGFIVLEGVPSSMIRKVSGSYQVAVPDPASTPSRGRGTGYGCFTVAGSALGRRNDGLWDVKLGGPGETAAGYSVRNRDGSWRKETRTFVAIAENFKAWAAKVEQHAAAGVQRDGRDGPDGP